jgi:hypothetical protein
MFSSVCALPSPTSVGGRQSFIADELILAPSPSHSHGRNESGDRDREKHSSGAGIAFLKTPVTHGPRIAPTRPTQDCDLTEEETPDKATSSPAQ